jgi:hypothetical protein
VRSVLAALVVGALLFGAITWYALEGSDVAVLRTRASDGGFEETRVWIVESGELAFIEAASPEREWYQSLRMYPEVEVLRRNEARRYRAEPELGPDGRARIRSMLREKYGWADWWVGWIQDTSDSIAVRLEPIDSDVAAAPE